jgi:hypothetical protein
LPKLRSLAACAKREVAENADPPLTALEPVRDAESTVFFAEFSSKSAAGGFVP